MKRNETKRRLQNRRHEAARTVGVDGVSEAQHKESVCMARAQHEHTYMYPMHALLASTVGKSTPSS